MIIRGGLACFEWIALGFQTAAMVLLAQSWEVFAHGPVYLANFGLVASAVLVILTLVGMMLSVIKGTEGLVPWLSRLGKQFLLLVGWTDIATRYLQIQRRQGPEVGQVFQQTAVAEI